MIQDIYPSRLKNEYENYIIRDVDNLLIFDKHGRILVRDALGKIEFLKGADKKEENAFYLFSIDDKRYFLLDSFKNNIGNDRDERNKQFEYYTIREIRDKFSGTSMVEVFAAFTAYHLWKWYAENRFCGKCGSPLKHGDKERSLICPDCGNVIYPRINPAVIVGVTKEDKLLLTRYRRGYAHNALVAGFTEIGETLEETVAREVMEETGVSVKNIRYYKSQPWGMAQDILVGFFCEAQGDGEIHMDEDELKYAEWVRREDIELQPNNLSLTNEMMKVFKEGMRHIRLVEVTEEEIPVLHDMQVKSFMPLYDKYHDDCSPAIEPIERVRARYEVENRKYYFIMMDGARVGAINIGHNDPNEKKISFISPLFILPEFQNKGIGYIAIQQAFELLPEVTTWKLETILQEKGNCHLYEKCGFVRTGEQMVVNDKMTLIMYELHR